MGSSERRLAAFSRRSVECPDPPRALCPGASLLLFRLVVQRHAARVHNPNMLEALSRDVLGRGCMHRKHIAFKKDL